MGLNPLDLQTMYSQIDNVAKQAAHLTQGLQLSQAMQQEESVRKNLEEASKVSRTKESAGAKGIGVDSDGKNGGDEHSSDGKKKPDNPYAEKADESARLKEDYLGRHIDVVR